MISNQHIECPLCKSALKEMQMQYWFFWALSSNAAKYLFENFNADVAY